jgi:NADPH:quinone reductase-like Zn-dependent oxidoreductase
VSLNFRDVLMARGLYNPKQPLPLVPCSDGAGEVVEIGPGVTRVKVGDGVMGLFAQGWLAGRARLPKLRSTLGGPRPGMLRSEAVLPEDGVVKMPAGYTFEQASTLPCAAVTAWSALEQAALTAGDVVLVQGTGGVSLFAAQLAKQRGARVLATSKSDEKLERAKRELGVDEGINYVAHPKWSAEVRRLTAKEGADVIVEVGGGATFGESCRAVRAGGTIALIGVLSGTSSEVPLTPILMQNVRVQGVLVGHRDAFEALVRAIESGGLQPTIDRVFEFGEAATAFEYLTKGQHFGKVVVTAPS